MTAPVIFVWSGTAMEPMPRFIPLCNRQYIAGERYKLVAQEERSTASHNHYFARLEEVFNNLPDAVALEFPTREHLRKWALCRIGYYDITKKIACKSEKEARHIAAIMRTMLPGDSEYYAEISVRGHAIVEIKPKSQSRKEMGNARFQDSKEKVLDLVSSLINVTPKELSDNAGRAA